MEKISKAKIQAVRALRQKKVRSELREFVAEGRKCVADTFGYFVLRMLVATESWIRGEGRTIAAKCPSSALFVASRGEMERMSSLSTAPDVIAVYEIPGQSAADWMEGVEGRLSLALDGVQDPGNLGTIVRAADWFGVHHIVCSPDTADLYNAKAVQATMGAVSRVRILYTPLEEFLGNLPSMPVCGTLLDGDDIYRAELEPRGVIVLGSEGRGISPGVRELVTSRLRIPSFPTGEPTSESLNVGVAAAVTLSEFRRREL